MGAIIYIGDEVCASGFRLAGIETRVPGGGDEAAVLAEARGQASVVLLCERVAARLPAANLQTALCAVAPLTVLMPDLRGGGGFADLAAVLRRQLEIGP